ncbi:MAG TPA: DUF2127 domain-containing protein, partial [Vicinamibacterales bacterium]
MTDVQSTGAPARLPESADTYHVDPGRGWLLFAGIMLALVGVLNVIYGIAAIDNSTFYVRDVEFVLADLQTWGWVLLIVGIVQLIAAVGVWQETEWGRWLGIGLAVGNALVQFFVLPAHPVWALMVFFVDIIIIFGLL